ncbi:MAG: bacterial transcriptional activator domain-containing protein [Anaerolineae bacterium]|nr:bacterial transcriptional activator domain-containing protein [Anaerolineae bacterium]
MAVLKYVEGVAELSLEEFERDMRGKPIVIIYPRHRGRSALVGLFLETYQQNIVYYGLSEHDNTIKSWLDNMITDPSFPEGFGSQTRQALNNRPEPEELAETFGADLATLRSEPYMLLLDMFDNLEPSKEMGRFFRALPNYMPGHAQIVINARLLNLQPWNDMLHAGQVGVVGNRGPLGNGIYGEDQKLGQLEVFALSGGHVYIDGRPVTRWDGSLPRHLFYYFVDHTMVTRDEIFDIFWPKMSVKEATNVFHVTKRKISERLGYELTNYSSGFYVPSPRLSIHYDARLFENLVAEAIENEEAKPANWYRAVQLYRSHYLPYIHTPWVTARRDELKHKYAQALIGLGRYHLALDEMEPALGYLLRALREKPDWEDVHQDVMTIYFQQGRIADAVQQYRKLEETLHRMFGIKPTADTRSLFEVIAATG